MEALLSEKSREHERFKKYETFATKAKKKFVHDKQVLQKTSALNEENRSAIEKMNRIIRNKDDELALLKKLRQEEKDFHKREEALVTSAFYEMATRVTREQFSRAHEKPSKSWLNQQRNSRH